MKISDRINAEVARSLLVAKQAKVCAQQLAKVAQSGQYRRLVETTFSMEGEGVVTYGFAGSNTLYLQINVAKLTGFADPRLMGVLTAFEYHNPDFTGIEEFAHRHTKVVNYTFRAESEIPGLELSIRVSVEATIATDSETCKQMVIGYTQAVIAKPIYKMICDSEAELTAIPSTV